MKVFLNLKTQAVHTYHFCSHCTPALSVSSVNRRSLFRNVQVLNELDAGAKPAKIGNGVLPAAYWGLYLWQTVQNSISLLFCTNSSGSADPNGKG